MPIYEYECEQCGRVEEAIQKFSEAPLTQCRHCTGKLNKLVSQSSFHLKGSGWYVTDYAKKPRTSPPASNPDTKAKKDDGPGPAKTDSAGKPD